MSEHRKPSISVWVKHPTADMWRCDTIIGRYQVSSIVSPASWTFDGLPGAEANGVADGETNAKAAAQAHFDDCIRSVLYAASISRAAQIESIREWSEQKYGEAFSVSACHDLLSAISTTQP